ncbi:uncharacterized protein K02A2.6-like [Patiria miniata]|uniref:Endonuclease n=1 Tax=Patiria miniata TaxID=46514 RepID=A0A914AI01_PATMI|nr:uncharacterized protein K02A2.6-like [Patiria miniata]
MASIPPPPFFLVTPGTPPVPWTQWRGMFETYTVASAANTYPAVRKRALLLHCLGTEGQRVFHTLPQENAGENEDEFDSALRVLDRHFKPKLNVVAERYRFRRRSQLPGESVDDYIRELRALASSCNFGNMTDELIRDQFIERTYSTQIRERLLLEPDLTLTDAITISRQVESALRESKIIGENSSHTPEADVHAVTHRKPRQQNRKPRKHRNTTEHPPQQSRPAPLQSQICYRCGEQSHKANDPNCKAKYATCSKCGKMGHYPRVCRSGQRFQSTRNQVQGVFTSDNPVAPHPDYQDSNVLTIQHIAHADSVKCSVLLGQSVQLAMTVDTGAAVSIIPASTFGKFFAREALQPSTAKLTTYLHEPITVLGTFHTAVRLASNPERCVPAHIFVVQSGIAIMGLDLIRRLDITITGGKVMLVNGNDSKPPSSTPPAPTATTPSDQTSMDMRKQYPELFNGKVGLAKNYVHKVKVRPSVPPMQQKLRKLPFSVRDEVANELKRLEDADIIERIDASEWVSPLVVAYKKSGKVRLCVDLREVNKAVIVDKYPLPNIQELLGELHGASVFSSLDMNSAYHQLLLHEDSRDLTAFITHVGLFRFKRVCFGLASAPSAFQKFMSCALSGLAGVQCYLDDIVIFGRDQKDHDANLSAVLNRLTELGVTLNYDKCHFNLSNLRFLCHTVSSEGLTPDPTHVEALLNAPKPTDPSTLRSFMGHASYYARFVPNYATMVEPLRALLRKDTQFIWSEAAQSCFELLKQHISNATTLALFDPDLHTIVSTDASAYGIGAVLAQIKNNHEVPIAFASRSLTTTERKYSVSEREALACVWACEKWYKYLWGRQFTLRTDHQALTTLLSTRGTGHKPMRIARWAARLLNFNYTVEFRAGAHNRVADALSRLPLPTTVHATEHTDDEIIVQWISALLVDASAITKADLQSATRTDTILKSVSEYITSGWPAKQHITTELQPYFHLQDELSVADDCLLRGDRFVIPTALQSSLITIAHQGHQGIVRTKQRLRDCYWWPGMDKQIEHQVRHCAACQVSDKTAYIRTPPLQPVPLPAHPWQKIAIDICGPFEHGPQNCRFAIVLMDYYSKWPEVAFAADATSHSVCSMLDSIFAREGLPNELVSDNGSQFVSTEFESYLIQRGIKHIRTSLYHPQANGLVERFNRVLKQTLQIATREHRPWKTATLELLTAYRSTAHATTGKSPAELLHSRRMTTTLNILPTEISQEEPADIRDRVRSTQTKYKRYTDQKRGAVHPRFQTGDYVRVKNPRHVHKGSNRYGPPQRITQSKGPSTYQLEDGRTWNATHLTMTHKLPNQMPTTPRQPATPKPQNRPKRQVRQPTWVKDYHM